MNKELEAYKIIEEEIIGSINDGRTKRIINLYEKQLQIIEEALKRNEPMKLKTKRVKVSIDDYRIDDYCPTCDEELYTTSNYCPHCGQRLDWSELNRNKKGEIK